MNIDRSVLAFGGFMVLVSAILSMTVHPAFIWLTLFVGANLLQSAFTGFCPAAKLFKLLGSRSGNTFR